MNRRINKIILDALHEKKETLHSYAELFKVSDQTIRNDIKEINYYLEKNNQTKIIFDNDGCLRMAKEVDLQELLKTYASFQNYHLSQDERRTILAMLLVTSCDYVTTYYLSEYVLVSRNTLVSDIEELKIWFKRNGLVLHSYVGKGYKVQGNEAKIRQAMMKLIIFNGLFDTDYDYALGFENNIFQNLLLDIIDKNTRYQEIAQLLLEIEKEQGLQLSDFSYQEVVCYLLIMVERLSLGFIIHHSKESAEVEGSSKAQFAAAIVERLAAMYQLTIRDGEKSDLIAVLRSKSYIKNNSRKIDSIETQILINEFIFNLSKELNIKYYLNSDLFDLLENHLKLLIYRIKLKSNVKNGLFDEVYQAYADIFPLVKQNLQKIETFLETEVTPDEVSFIVMYVMAILENNINNSLFEETIRVRVICNSGRGTAQLIKIKLKKAFPQIDIVSVDSSHVLKKIQPENQDFIITTVPLQFDKSPVLLVNPLLTEDDIVAIQKVIYRLTPQNLAYDVLPIKDKQLIQSCLPIIEKYVEEEHHQKFVKELEELYRHNQTKRRIDTKEISRLSDILTVDRVILDAHAADWKDAVTAAGTILLNEQCIEQRYIKSMIQMIEAHDSYIVISPGVAIPHGEAAAGALQISASFLRLKEPVNFNHKQNDPVSYVIALSIPEGKTIGTCLYYFTEMLATEAFIPKMDACAGPEEVLLELKKMEDKVMGFSYEKNTM